MGARPGSSQQQLVFRMCKMLISAQTSASATCHQYLDGPQLSPTSLGWERGRGYSVLVSRAMSQGMLWCREVWRGWQLRKQVMQTSSLHQKAPPRVDKWQQKLQGYPARPSPRIPISRLEMPKLSFSCSQGKRRPEPGGSCWGQPWGCGPIHQEGNSTMHEKQIAPSKPFKPL